MPLRIYFDNKLIADSKKIQKKRLDYFLFFKNSYTFAHAFEKKRVWRDGRVVDCGGLENR